MSRRGGGKHSIGPDGVIPGRAVPWIGFQPVLEAFTDRYIIRFFLQQDQPSRRLAGYFIAIRRSILNHIVLPDCSGSLSYGA